MKVRLARLAAAAFLSAPFILVLFAHARQYLPFISDDALISLRYVKRLIHGGGLSWTDGRPVEGYSNLLWILTIAVPGAFGLDLIRAARLAGLTGMAVAMFSLAYAFTTRRHRASDEWFAITVALLFLALGGPMAVWAIGGLEQPLYVALIAISVAAMFTVVEQPAPRALRGLSLALGLLCLTRPEGPLFAVLAAVALVLTRRDSTRVVPDLSMLLLIPFLFTTGQLLFRLGYYGAAVPNTALVKLAPSIVHWQDGMRYLSSGLRALLPWPLLAGIAACVGMAHARSRARLMYPVLVAIAWSAYVVFIGGDIFPAYRHLLPLMVVIAFVLAEGAHLLSESLTHRRSLRYVVMAAVLLLFIPYARTQSRDKQNERAIRERWEWQGREVAGLLKTAFGRQRPLIAVTAAGAIPYWSDLPALDMLGLNDYYIPRHPPPDFGSGVLGHELGDADYVLGRRPDIIIFTVGSEPEFRIGDELRKRAEFHERYVPVTAVQSGYTVVLYFNKESARIGMLPSETTLAIPGFLFTGTGTVAVLNARNELVARLPPGGSARLSFSSPVPRSVVLDIDASQPLSIDSATERSGAVTTVTLRSRSTASVDVRRVVVRPAL